MMTINQEEQIQNYLQQQKVSVFDEKNGILRESAEWYLHWISDMQQKLWETLSKSGACRKDSGKHNQRGRQLQRNMKRKAKGAHLNEDSRLHKKQVNEVNNTDGGVDFLLILADSAEMLESDDRINRLSRKHRRQEVAQHALANGIHATVTDNKSAGKQMDRTTVINHVQSEEDGLYWAGKTALLSTTPHQSHSKSNLTEQPRPEEHTARLLSRKSIRLAQVRCLARSKNHLQLPEAMEMHLCGNIQGKAIRLTQVKCMARSKNNLSVQEATIDHFNKHLNCQTSRDNHRAIIAEIFGEENSCEDVGDCHPSDVGSAQGSNTNEEVNQSVPAVNGETLDKKISLNGRMRLTQVKRFVRLKHAGVQDRGEGESVHLECPRTKSTDDLV